MNQFYSTRQAAGLLNIKPGTLQKAIWQGRVKPPMKGPSGQYLWKIRDVESAAWAFRCYEQFSQNVTNALSRRRQIITQRKEIENDI